MNYYSWNSIQDNNLVENHSRVIVKKKKKKKKKLEYKYSFLGISSPLIKSEIDGIK